MLSILTAPLFLLLTFLINFFPSGSTLPSGFHTAVTALGGYLHILDPLVPISTLLTCVSLIFAVEISLFGFKFLRWVLGHIPQIGGNG